MIAAMLPSVIRLAALASLALAPVLAAAAPSVFLEDFTWT